MKKNEFLGSGTFGSVEVVLWHGDEYAAKQLNSDVRGQDKKAFYERFRREYDLLSSLNHKNIVQYCGLCFLSHSESTGMPLLMMERLKMDLHRRLLNYPEYSLVALTITEKLSILVDIAEGLLYLHTHRVIHQDLTARNVLLDQNNTAKIGDFGNSRILDINESSCIESKSCNIGTFVYSAPEVLPATSSRSYNEKIDIFSFGHLSLFTMIDEFPNQLRKPVEVQMNGAKFAYSEVERRCEYMEKLKIKCKKDSLSARIPTLVVQCLDNRPQKRPDAKQLLQQLKSVSGFL